MGGKRHFGTHIHDLTSVTLCYVRVLESIQSPYVTFAGRQHLLECVLSMCSERLPCVGIWCVCNVECQQGAPRRTDARRGSPGVASHPPAAGTVRETTGTAQVSNGGKPGIKTHGDKPKTGEQVTQINARNQQRNKQWSSAHMQEHECNARNKQRNVQWRSAQLEAQE